MAVAGESARREYERRRAKDREAERRARPYALKRLLIGTPLVFLVVRFGGPVALDLLFGALNSGAGHTTEPLVDAGTATLLAGGASCLWAMNVLQQWLGTRRTTEAWRIGAEGEEATAAALASLEPEWTLVHDLEIPRSKANVDHVAVGPGGVVVIETKNVAADVAIRGGRLRRGGRSADAWVAEVRREAAAVQATLDVVAPGVTARPVILVHGGVDSGWGRPQIDEIVVAGPKTIRKWMNKLRATLSASQIEEIAAELRTGLRRPVAGAGRAAAAAAAVAAAAVPTGGSTVAADAGDGGATAPTSCECGGTPTRRRARAGGTEFYGCSSFPRCRRTWPVPLTTARPRGHPGETNNQG